MKRTDIETTIGGFKAKSAPEDRYSSFDYCYNYFRKTSSGDLKKDIEKSCLTLGFYLASWGMLRGSSFLLEKSAKHLEPTISYIASLDKSVWAIDVDTYTEKNVQTIIQIYNETRERLIPDGNTDLTLITKTLLGVFGFIPAFDNYFCNTFREIADGQCGFRRVNLKSLNYIKAFYEANKQIVDKLSIETYTNDFVTGEKTKVNYTKAKIIDMYGFTSGLDKRMNTKHVV